MKTEMKSIDLALFALLFPERLILDFLECFVQRDLSYKTRDLRQGCEFEVPDLPSWRNTGRITVLGLTWIVLLAPFSRQIRI